MLSAAHDLLAGKEGSNEKEEELKVGNKTRYCNTMSTGAILLADILPALIIKLVSPFIPIGMHIQVVMLIAFSVAGYVLVGTYISKTLMILGVVFTSLASGVGESSFLSYMPCFDCNVISAWSSGTGGAGVLGALSYLAFRWAGVSPSVTILVMNVIPGLMAVAFWIVLVHPDTSCDNSSVTQEYLSIGDKFRVFKAISVKYMLPFGLVYVFEYFINQGLSELITFDGIFPPLDAQYRWYSLDYQIGVLISRSSGGVLEINNTWLMALFQAINLVIMTTEAVYRWIGYFWIVIALILWEGLLGGCSYVNTFRRINQEMDDNKKEFAMSMTAFADSLGITIAGLAAIPVHNAICELPPP